MAWTKAKTTVVAGVVLILAAGTTTVIVKHSGQKAVQPVDVQSSRVSTVAFQQESIRRITDAKNWALGFFMYASDHKDQFPKTLAEVKSGGYVKNLSDDNWEVVSGGSLKSFTQPATTILLREKEGRPTPDGAYVKAYAFADGHAEIIRSADSDFEAVERDHGLLVKPAD